MTDSTFLPGVRASRAAHRIARRWVRRAARLNEAARAHGYRTYLVRYLTRPSYDSVAAVTAATVAAGGECVLEADSLEHVLREGVLYGRPLLLVGGENGVEDAIAFRKALLEAARAAQIAPPRLVPMSWTPGVVSAGLALVLARRALAVLAGRRNARLEGDAWWAAERGLPAARPIWRALKERLWEAGRTTS